MRGNDAGNLRDWNANCGNSMKVICDFEGNTMGLNA